LQGRRQGGGADANAKQVGVLAGAFPQADAREFRDLANGGRIRIMAATKPIAVAINVSGLNSVKSRNCTLCMTSANTSPASIGIAAAIHGTRW
jgi:hypothetical protein